MYITVGFDVHSVVAAPGQVVPGGCCRSWTCLLRCLLLTLFQVEFLLLYVHACWVSSPYSSQVPAQQHVAVVPPPLRGLLSQPAGKRVFALLPRFLMSLKPPNCCSFWCTTFTLAACT